MPNRLFLNYAFDDVGLRDTTANPTYMAANPSTSSGRTDDLICVSLGFVGIFFVEFIDFLVAIPNCHIAFIDRILQVLPVILALDQVFSVFDGDTNHVLICGASRDGCRLGAFGSKIFFLDRAFNRSADDGYCVAAACQQNTCNYQPGAQDQSNHGFPCNCPSISSGTATLKHFNASTPDSRFRFSFSR